MMLAVTIENTKKKKLNIAWQGFSRFFSLFFSNSLLSTHHDCNRTWKGISSHKQCFSYIGEQSCRRQKIP